MKRRRLVRSAVVVALAAQLLILLAGVSAAMARVGIKESAGPFVRGLKVTALGGSGKGKFGSSVAVSANGRVALIGAPTNGGDVGAAWVFVRRGSRWVRQGQRLVGQGEIGDAAFGWSVALSANGDTALISGIIDDRRRGAVWVFRRSGSVWRQQAKLTGRDEVGRGEFGFSVALSADGNTALIGAPDDRTPKGLAFNLNGGHGAAWIFTRTGAATWRQVGSKLTARGDSPTGDFGSAVALSGDGNSALIAAFNVGACIKSYCQGAVWPFVREGSAWRQQGARFVGSGEGRNLNFGLSLAISANGREAVIGGSGATWFYTHEGSRWVQQGSKRIARGQIGNAAFGLGTAIDGTGSTALIGGVWDNQKRGAAWVYTRTATGWRQEQKLTGGDEVGPPPIYFGDSVALSANGSIALIGGPWDNHKRGAAWVFKRAQSTA